MHAPSSPPRTRAAFHVPPVRRKDGNADHASNVGGNGDGHERGWRKTTRPCGPGRIRYLVCVSFLSSLLHHLWDTFRIEDSIHPSTDAQHPNVRNRRSFLLCDLPSNTRALHLLPIRAFARSSYCTPESAVDATRAWGCGQDWSILPVGRWAFVGPCSPSLVVACARVIASIVFEIDATGRRRGSTVRCTACS